MSDSTENRGKDTQSTFQDLMTLLHSEFERIQTSTDNNPERRHLVDILADGISKSLKEVRSGANVQEFKDSAVIHMLVDGSKEGYSYQELRDFVGLITDRDDLDEDDQ